VGFQSRFNLGRKRLRGWKLVAWARRVIFGAIASLSFVFPSAAIEVEGTAVSLELPEAYCRLTKGNAVESLYIEQQERLQGGHNLLVIVAAPCADIPSLRNGNEIKQYIIWLRVGAKPVPPPGLDRTSFINNVAKKIPSFDYKKLMPEIQSKARQEGMELTPEAFGLLEYDNDAVFVGSLHEVKADEFMIKAANVSAMTVIAGQSFSLNTYDRFDGRKTFDQLLVLTKDVIKKTLAANYKRELLMSLPKGMKPIQ
jgi:hypothetical protein